MGVLMCHACVCDGRRVRPWTGILLEPRGRTLPGLIDTHMHAVDKDVSARSSMAAPACPASQASRRVLWHAWTCDAHGLGPRGVLR
jgi:hypothetical protein